MLVGCTRLLTWAKERNKTTVRATFEELSALQAAQSFVNYRIVD